MSIMARSQTSLQNILVTGAAFVIIVAGIKAGASIIIPIILAAFISMILAPLLYFLKQKGLPSALALTITLLLVVGLGTVVGTIFGSTIKNLTADLPRYQEKFQGYYHTIMEQIESYGINLGMQTDSAITDGNDEELTEPSDPQQLNQGNEPAAEHENGPHLELRSLLTYLSRALSSIGNFVSDGFTIFLLVSFMLVEAAGFPRKLAYAFGIQSGNQSPFEQFTQAVKQYLVIKTWISLLTGSLVGVGLWILGVQYAVLWGLLAFLLNYIPTIGSIIAAIPPIILALIDSSAGVAIGAAVICLGSNLLCGNVLEPRFMGKGMGLSSLVVFLSLLCWGWLLGPVGMLLSIPLTILVKIGLEVNQDTRWIAFLLGPNLSDKEMDQLSQRYTKKEDS